MTGDLNEGWAYLINSTKWHYFVDQKSLCRKFGLFAKPDYEQGNDDSEDNCVGCKRELIKRKEKLNDKHEEETEEKD